jgi:hypothetical protein
LGSVGLLLVGCGGTDGLSASDVPDPGPQGFYAGSLVSETSGASVAAYALVADDGSLRIIEPALGRQFTAPFPASGDDWHATLAGYSGPAADFPDGSARCMGMVNGSAFAAAELIGSYACGGDHGRFDLSYDDAVSFDPQDVGLLTGVAEDDAVSGDVLVLDIAPDGSFSGSDSAGCGFSGRFTVADPVVDIYSMRLRRDCAGRVADLDGLATLATDPLSGAPALYYGVSDPWDSLAGLLVFQ